MKNAFKYGISIGIASGIWILILHFSGVYEEQYPVEDRISWLEYASVIIPLVGLFLGIKNFRDNYNGGKMEFVEGLLEGFKIMLVGAIITAFFFTIYNGYVNNITRNMDYTGRIGGAGLIGVLFTLAISLLLMNKQRNL